MKEFTHRRIITIAVNDTVFEMLTIMFYLIGYIR